MRSSMVDVAVELQRKKLPITLCVGKRPLGRGWNSTNYGSGWPDHRWSTSEIERAFDVRGELNIGVLLGPKSGLIDIEADGAEQERAFADLFDGCEIPVTPVFKSLRGKHRLFRWDDALRTIGKGVVSFRGLEIRIGADGKGAQSLLPPSLNTDGTARQWLVPLDDCKPAPLPSVVLQRIIEANRGKVDIDGAANTAYGLSTTVSPKSSTSIEEAIRSTLPAGLGKRNRAIFDFARKLKSIPEFSQLSLKELRPLVRRWHEAALPFIGTKPFETTWLEFGRAWKAVRHPEGHGPIDTVFADAIKSAARFPPAAAREYEQSGVKLLVALCRQLQRIAGSEPFFLSCREAGRLLGVSHTEAWDWLSLLVMDQVLSVVEAGSHSTRRASTFRYLGELEP